MNDEVDRMLDEIDRKLLAIVQDGARTNNAEIARRVGMAPSAVLERVRKLEQRGVIGGYQARVNPRALGLDLLAFVFVRTDETLAKASTGDRLAEIPEVQEVHHVAGEDCYLIKVRAASTAALGRLLRHRLGPIPTVISTRSTIVFDTVKESALLPLDGSPGDYADELMHSSSPSNGRYGSPPSRRSTWSGARPISPSGCWRRPSPASA